MIPKIEQENISEQVEEILKTQNKELVLDLIRNKISEAFTYGVISNVHTEKFLRYNNVPHDKESYLKFKGL